jgi:hypothetical protein
MKRILLYVGVVLLVYISVVAGLWSAEYIRAETTTLPSWSTGTGYSECSEDVRLVVSPTPLQAKEIRLLITDGYEFMTVLQYEGSFYWYFVRYKSCWEYDWEWGTPYDNDDTYWYIPNTDNGGLDIIPDRRGW